MPSSTRILGIDPATKSGIAMVEFDHETGRAVDMYGAPLHLPGDKRYDYKAYMDALDGVPADYIIIERPFFPDEKDTEKRTRSLRAYETHMQIFALWIAALKETHGAVPKLYQKRDLHMKAKARIIWPATWMSILGTRGKQQTQALVWRKLHPDDYNVDTRSGDVIDALGMCLAQWTICKPNPAFLEAMIGDDKRKRYRWEGMRNNGNVLFR